MADTKNQTPNDTEHHGVLKSIRASRALVATGVIAAISWASAGQEARKTVSQVVRQGRQDFNAGIDDGLQLRKRNLPLSVKFDAPTNPTPTLPRAMGRLVEAVDRIQSDPLLIFGKSWVGSRKTSAQMPSKTGINPCGNSPAQSQTQRKSLDGR
jgi:hypothetical protein